MFRKLIKHEFRAMSGLMFPMSLVLDFAVMSMASGLFSTVYVIMAVMFAVVVSFWFVWFGLSAWRFHKNLLEYEGHMMMTIPVRVDALILSKFLCSMLWLLIGIVVTMAFPIVASYGYGTLPTMSEVLVTAEATTESGVIPYVGLRSVTYLIYMPLLVFISAAATCLSAYAASAIGHSFVRKKTLLSILIFVGMTAVYQFISFRFAETTFYAQWVQRGDPNVMVFLELIPIALLAVLYFYVTRYFLRHRLHIQ